MDLESVETRLVAVLRLLRQHGWVHLKEDVVERRAKVSAVDGVVARRLWVVDVFALGAVQLDMRGVGYIMQAHGEQMLRVADDARALSEYALLVLVELLAQVSVSSVKD